MRLHPAPPVRLTLTLLSLCALAACKDPGLGRVGNDWSASPSRLDFGSVFLGSTGTAKLTLTNSTRGNLELTLSTSAPFEAPAAEVTVPGGSSLDVDVVFRPSALGPADGVLRVGALEVPLAGEGLAQPVCESSDACRTSRFEPSTGACVEEAKPNGTACANACLDGASCFDGQCLGTRKGCDDGNACTLDACDATLGCTHTDTSSLCPASVDPCQRAVCVPAQGCGLEPQPDGTSCGDHDCNTSRICLASRCETRPTPDGAECAAAGPCQRASTCHANTCVAGAETMLKERWRYARAGHRIFFEGTVDEGGTAWFTESSRTDPAAALQLVALNKDGRETHRVELQRPCMGCSARLMLDAAAQRIIVARAGTVQARRMTDGAQLWSRDTTAGRTLRSAMPDGGASWSSTALIGLTPDLVVEQLEEGYEVHRQYAVALDRSTGAVAWERDFWGHMYFPGALATNELWVTAADCWAPISQSQVFDARGAPTGSVTRQARPLAFSGSSALLLGSDLVWATGTGQSAPQPAPARSWSWALASKDRLVLADYQGARELQPDGGARWAKATSGYVSTGALLADSGTLIAAYTNDGGTRLFAFDGTGRETLSCLMPGTVNSGAPSHGLFIAPVTRGGEVAIVGFEVPVAPLEATGWVTPNGSPANDRRPR